MCSTGWLLAGSISQQMFRDSRQMRPAIRRPNDCLSGLLKCLETLQLLGSPRPTLDLRRGGEKRIRRVHIQHGDFQSVSAMANTLQQADLLEMLEPAADGSGTKCGVLRDLRLSETDDSFSIRTVCQIQQNRVLSHVVEPVYLENLSHMLEGQCPTPDCLMSDCWRFKPSSEYTKYASAVPKNPSPLKGTPMLAQHRFSRCAQQNEKTKRAGTRASLQAHVSGLVQKVWLA